MPAKESTSPLPKYVTPMKRKGKVVAYKYQRRVPKDVRDLATKMGAAPLPAMLNIYLAANVTDAGTRAQSLTTIHDELFASLKTPEGALTERTVQDAAKIMQQTFDAQNDPTKPPPKGASWKDWQTALTGISRDDTGLSDNDKAQLLAAYLASAFDVQEAADIAMSTYPYALATLPPSEPILVKSFRHVRQERRFPIVRLLRRHTIADHGLRRAQS